jgi:hypothetical protein
LRHRPGGGRDYFFAAEPEMNNRRSTLLFGLALLVGFSGVWKLQSQIDAQRAALYQEQDELVLRSGPLLKLMSLEYAPLVADLYWTRAVQYYGDKRARHDPNLDLLWPLLDVATTLDPHLIVAYRFGSTFLSEPSPRGAGRPDLGIGLINRGIHENPEYWRLYEDLGFIYYFELKDHKRAAAAFLEGSRNPNALVWMKIMAARMSEQGETRETAAFLWKEIYDSATDPEIKNNAYVHLQLLRAEADCEELDKVAAAYEKRTGKHATSLNDLVRERLLPNAPIDPRGFAYQFNADGKAQLNPASPLFKDQPRYQKPF